MKKIIKLNIKKIKFIIMVISVVLVTLSFFLINRNYVFDSEEETAIVFEENFKNEIVENEIIENESENDNSSNNVTNETTENSATEIIETESIDEVANIETETTVNTIEQEYTFTDMTKVMYGISSVNIRNLPSTNGVILGTISYNEAISVSGRCNETGWYRIEYNGYTGYVSDNYLSDIQTEISSTIPESTTSVSAYVPEISTYEGNVQFASNDINRDFGYKVESELAYVPDIIMKYLYDHGWTITLTNDLSPYTSVPDAIGVCTFSTKSIHILANSNAIKLSTVHEIGHAVQRYKNFAKSSQKDAYAMDRSLGVFYSPDRIGEDLSHYTASVEEYDAQCFLIYYKYGESILSDAAPNYSSVFISNINTWLNVIK